MTFCSNIVCAFANITADKRKGSLQNGYFKSYRYITCRICVTD